EAEAECRAVAREAKRLQLPRIQAKAVEGLGLLLERSERPEDALDQYRRAEEILEPEPPTVRVDAVAGKARCFHSLGDVRYEIHVLETLLGEIEHAGLRDPNALARVHSALAYAYVDAGLFQKAAESAAPLEAFEPQLTGPLRVAQMHMHVAPLHLAQGKPAEAERSLHRAEEAYGQLHPKAET